MAFDDSILRSDERAVFLLRSLYSRYGYLPYKMSKFEEYDLYVRNKDFLLSDRIITFNDTNGKLMALKPDVTLSIIKNGDDAPGCKQKVYYNENVYRVSERTHRFKEIMQAGLECIGDIGLYDIYEVITLAAKTLEMISPDYVLEISQMDILSFVLSSSGKDAAFQKKAASFIAEKNTHDLKRLCREYGASSDTENALCALISCYGDMESAIGQLRNFLPEEEIKSLVSLSGLLKSSPCAPHIHLDFSVVSDMNYYNGFVFRGFINGLCDGVLTGGQYDRMMGKLGRASGAIGFALYLDMLSYLNDKKSEKDVDVLLLCSDDTPVEKIIAETEDILRNHLSVSVQKAIPAGLRWDKMIDLRKEAAPC